MTNSSVPAYEPLLEVAHRAKRHQLRAVLAALRVRPGMCVLDVASGDGWYSRRLSAAVGRAGQVWAIDLDTSYLNLARVHATQSGNVFWTCGEGTRLPFADATFDVTWCAHSLVSLARPAEVIAEMRRVTRPGGRVAVLENDSLHDVLLPWPIDFELAVRQAELLAYQRDLSRPDRPYVGRSVQRFFRLAGFTRCFRRTFAQDFSSPLDADAREFLARYLQDLERRTAPYLAADMRRRLTELCDPRQPGSMWREPGAAMTTVETLHWAVVGSRRRGHGASPRCR